MKPGGKQMRGKRGFQRASGLLAERIRKTSESRGFAESRILTHWAEIVGQDVAKIARPVNVSYGRGGFGATLTLLTTGANAPMLQMQVETLKERVNACYGYAAIRHIRITQTAPTGFAEGKAQFAPAPMVKPAPDTQSQAKARAVAAPVADDGLRQALERLAANVITRNKQS